MVHDVAGGGVCEAGYAVSCLWLWPPLLIKKPWVLPWSGPDQGVDGMGQLLVIVGQWTLLYVEKTAHGCL